LVALGPAVFFPSRTFFDRDISMFWLPRTEAFVRTIAEGAWPVWVPNVAFGMPMLADPTFQVVYPFTWLNLVLRPASSYELFAVSHAVLGGVGTCLLVRERVADARAALLAGGLFSTCGPFISALGMAPHFAGASWLPWVSWCALRLLDRPAVAPAGALAAVVALQVFTGSGEMCTVSAVACAVVVASTLHRRPPHARRILGSFALAAILGAGLSAIQWLPTLAILGEGSRLGLTKASLAAWSLHPLSLLDLIAPQLLSDAPLSAKGRTQVFDGREPFLASLYLGAPALVFVVLALERRRRFSLVAAAAFLACLVIALGRHTPAWSLLTMLPPFSLFRYPVKYMIPAALCWVVLAALGFARWAQACTTQDAAAARRAGGTAAMVGVLLLVVALHPPGVLAAILAEGGGWPKAPLVRSAFAVLVMAALVIWRGRSTRPPTPRVAWLAVGLILVDVALYARSVNRVGPVELLSHSAPVARRIASEGGARVYSVPYALADLGRQMARGPRNWAPEERWILGFVERLSPLSPGRWGLRGSFDGDVAGLAPPALSRATLLVHAHRPAALHLLRAAGVRWVVGLERWPELKLTEAFPSVYASPILLQEVPDALPETYLVRGARVEADVAALRLLSQGADPRAQVLLASGPPSEGHGLAGWSRVIERHADRVTIEVEASAPCWLVVTDGYSAGWRAHVDGGRVPVQRANVLFQAVPVGAGRHLVELRYVPRGLLLGAALTAATALVLAKVAGSALKRRGRSATIVGLRGSN
jgi:hypothetical protein